MGLGVFVVVESLRMPRYAHIGANPYSVPGLVPGVLGGALVLFGIVMVLREVMRMRRKDDSPSGGLIDPQDVITEAPETVPVAQPHIPGVPRLFITIILAVVYAFGMIGRLDFGLATGIFVFLFITIFEFKPDMGSRRFTRMVGLALVEAALVAVAIVVIFEKVFLVRLP